MAASAPPPPYSCQMRLADDQSLPSIPYACSIPVRASQAYSKRRRSSWAEPIYDRIDESSREGIIGHEKKYRTGWIYPELKENYASQEDIARYEKFAQAYANRVGAQEARRAREREEEREHKDRDKKNRSTTIMFSAILIKKYDRTEQ